MFRREKGTESRSIDKRIDVGEIEMDNRMRDLLRDKEF